MPKKNYGKLEEHVIDTMQRDRLFTYRDKMYEVMKVGKPRPNTSGGECKTDVFVRSYLCFRMQKSIGTAACIHLV